MDNHRSRLLSKFLRLICLGVIFIVGFSAFALLFLAFGISFDEDNFWPTLVLTVAIVIVASLLGGVAGAALSRVFEQFFDVEVDDFGKH